MISIILIESVANIRNTEKVLPILNHFWLLVISSFFSLWEQRNVDN